VLLGLMSDTHGNGEAILKVAAIFRHHHVAKIIHLGDDYEDVLFLQDEPVEVMAVPGLYCAAYRDPAIPNRRLVEMAGVRLLLTHSPKVSPYDLRGDGDPQALGKEVDLVLFGHTHRPQVFCQDGVWWINPGHLKAHDNRGCAPSYGLLRLGPSEVAVQIIALKEQEILVDYTMPLKRPRPRSARQEQEDGSKH
jgi:putative phosphoesterase